MALLDMITMEEDGYYSIKYYYLDLARDFALGAHELTT